MLFKQIKLGPMENFSYVIADTGMAMIVDPGWEVEKLISAAGENKIIGILLTHTHHDHIKELEKAVRLTGAKVYVHSSGVKNLNVPCEIFEGGDEIPLGDIKIKVLATPGHCPSCVCFLINNKLITGDTLFVEGCGRCDLDGSNLSHQWESLKKIKSLSDDLEVYPGHDYGSKQHTTIGYEKKHNRFLLCETEKDFIKIRMGG